MAIPKNPGVGQGQGGGRPRREIQVEEVRLRLSPEAAAHLHASAEALGVPAWKIVEHLLVGSGPLGSQEIARRATAAPELPPVALEIAREAAAFLEAHGSRSRAARAIRKAWARSLAMASRDFASGIDPEA